jgi:hypothetical protein
MRRQAVTCWRGKAVLVAFLLFLAGCTAPERREFFLERHPLPGDAAGDFTVEAPPVRQTVETGQEGFALPAEGETMEFSIEEAVVAALRANGDLRVSRLGPVVAGTFDEVERGDFDPELFLEAEYFKEKATETSRATCRSRPESGRRCPAAPPWRPG